MGFSPCQLKPRKHLSDILPFTTGWFKTTKNNKNSLNELQRYLWVADTGATCHVTNDSGGYISTKESDLKLVFGNSKNVENMLVFC